MSVDTRGQLRLATAALQLRGLKNAAKWCAEQLSGLDQTATALASAGGSAPSEPATVRTPCPSLPAASEALLRRSAADVSDRFLLARTYFDLGEFQRAAFVLQAPGGRPSSPSGDGGGVSGGSEAWGGEAWGVTKPSALRGLPGEELFLKAYALYLGGEKAKEQEALELADALDRPKAVNPNLRGLEQDLASLHEEGALDAFGLYIYG
jgi:anaphase-promoting complex subunit 8